MVMMADPIFGALNSIDARGKKILYMSPRGNILDQTKIQQLAEEEELTILCGHYEGVDQRVLDHFDMEEVSIGDYILTGGELPAMVLIDTVARLIPGVLAGDCLLYTSSLCSSQGQVDACKALACRCYPSLIITVCAGDFIFTIVHVLVRIRILV